MYQFTRDFVINGNKGKLKKDGELVKFKADVTNEVLMIDHVANLRKKEIASAYKRAFKAKKNDVLKLEFNAIDLSNYQEGDVVRLVITLGQEGRELSTFNDQYPWHARHYFYEAELNEEKSVADVVWQLAKGMERDNALSDLRYFEHDYDVTKKRSEAEATALTLTAADQYLRFFEVRFVKVGKTDADCPCMEKSRVGETLTGFMDWDKLGVVLRPELIEGSNEFAKLDEVGCEGNGNPEQIIKNLRVPTFEHMDWFGMNINGVELPVPNGEYNQYLIEYVTERRHIGHQVMGAIDKSLVSFVFFLDAEASEAFEAELAALGVAFDEQITDAAPEDKSPLPAAGADPEAVYGGKVEPKKPAKELFPLEDANA